jgi:hypothetical protein
MKRALEDHIVNVHLVVIYFFTLPVYVGHVMAGRNERY